MTRPQTIAVLCAVIAVFGFAANDAVIKLLSADYALYLVVLIRSAIGLALIVLILAPLTQERQIMRTRKLRLHLMRGCCVVMANMLFFLGLAAIPLAEAAAIFFVSPMLISVLSVLFLGEQVGPRRWAAIAVGFVGVLVVIRPGTDAFQPAALLPLGAALAYASTHILTRRMGGTESASTMAFYIQITFIGVSLVMGLAFGHGGFAGGWDHPSAEFLLRPWTVPKPADLWLFGLIGLGIATAGYCISQAYRLAEAAFVAPFEYLALPLSVVFGALVFNEYPDALTYLGIALILSSGVFVVWRDGRAARR